MMRRGWFRESYRHRLARRGIKTNFYAKKKSELRVPDSTPRVTLQERGKDPKKMLERLKAIPQVESAMREQALAETDISRAISGFRSSNPTLGLQILDKGKLKGYTTKDSGETVLEYRQMTSAERDALLGAAKDFAIQSRKAGLPNEGVEIALKNAGVDLSSIKERGLTPEEILKRERKRDVAISVAEAPILATEAVASTAAGAIGAGLSAEAEFLSSAWSAKAKPIPGGPGSANDFPGIFEVAPQVKNLPFFTENVVIGTEEQDDLSLPTHLSSVNVPPLSGSWNQIPARSGFLDSGTATEDDVKDVTRKVDMLSNEKHQLANGRTDAFRQGNVAFKKGHREDLLKAISELKSEEQKIRDRAGVVEQVHNRAMSTALQESKPSGNPALDGSLRSGAGRLVEQTDKMAEVREALKKNYDQVYLRRRDLEFKLQRMDAQLKPETSAPKKVKKFGEDDKGIVPSFRGVKNPIVKLRVPGKEE